MKNVQSLSVVIPVYNEVKNLPELYDRLKSVMDKVGLTYEIIFVDDGSRDGSTDYLGSLSAADGNVKSVILAHNYGQQAAMMAGFATSTGDVVITMDADLQNDPEDIPQFLAEISTGKDAVYSWRLSRKDPALTRKIPSYLINLMLSSFSGVRLHDYGCNFKAFRREVVEYILDAGESGKASAILGAKGARNISEIKTGHSERKHGESKYSMEMLFSLTMDIITGYSTRPFQAVVFLGLLSLFAATGFSVYYLAARIFLGMPPDPRIIVVALFLFFIGMQFVSLGFLGEFIIRIYRVCLKKPMYKIRSVLTQNPTSSDNAMNE